MLSLAQWGVLAGAVLEQVAAVRREAGDLLGALDPERVPRTPPSDLDARLAQWGQRYRDGKAGLLDAAVLARCPRCDGAAAAIQQRLAPRAAAGAQGAGIAGHRPRLRCTAGVGQRRGSSRRPGVMHAAAGAGSLALPSGEHVTN